jgi:hypothetical protein
MKNKKMTVPMIEKAIRRLYRLVKKTNLGTWLRFSPEFKKTFEIIMREKTGNGNLAELCEAIADNRN